MARSQSWSRLMAMLMISLSATLLVLTAPSLGMPLEAYTHEIHEERSVIPSGWKKGSRLEEHVILPIRIALAQSNMDKMNEYMMQISDPDSKMYGQHWTPERVRSTFSPSQETRDSVSQWLVASGVSFERLHHDIGSGGWIGFDATVAEAERLFKTEYFSWSHDQALGNEPIAAVSQTYSLPAHLRQHVDFITPTLHFDARLRRRENDQDDANELIETKKRRDTIAREKIRLGSPYGPSVPKKLDVYNPANIFNQLEQCDQFITLICLRALYGIPVLPSFTPTSPKNSFGIVEYTPQAYLGSDLDLFFANYSKNQKHKRPNLISIDGGALNDSNTGFDFNGESNLDLEYGMSLVNPIPVNLYQVGDAIESASFNDFLDALDASYCGGDDPTQDSPYPDPAPGGYKGQKACGTAPTSKVISTSYGYNEADLTPAYEIRQCNEYAKLGLLGVTWVYSSGDYGVAGNSGQCIGKNDEYNDGKSGRFNPSFPGTCPYILSVGATQVSPGKTVLDPESACETVIYSGGGFSNVFQQPDYQKNAVQTYFNNFKPTYSASQYNNSQLTRGYPDVSGNGANYIVTVAGKVSRVFGTSASAPLVASILTLINEARFNIGKGSIGFVNPTFYANPGLFNDITNGTNPGCGTQGFSAVKGWDPVTGLGTPNYPRLLAYFLAH